MFKNSIEFRNLILHPDSSEPSKWTKEPSGGICIYVNKFYDNLSLCQQLGVNSEVAKIMPGTMFIENDDNLKEKLKAKNLPISGHGG